MLCGEQLWVFEFVCSGRAGANFTHLPAHHLGFKVAHRYQKGKCSLPLRNCLFSCVLEICFREMSERVGEWKHLFLLRRIGSWLQQYVLFFEARCSSRLRLRGGKRGQWRSGAVFQGSLQEGTCCFNAQNLKGCLKVKSFSLSRKCTCCASSESL